MSDIQDFDLADSITLEQKSAVFAGAMPGERLWAFTRRLDGSHVLAAQFCVGSVREVGLRARYGAYRVHAEPGTTVLYDVAQGAPVEIIRTLSIRPRAWFLGQAFKAITPLVGSTMGTMLAQKGSLRLSQRSPATPHMRT